MPPAKSKGASSKTKAKPAGRGKAKARKAAKRPAKRSASRAAAKTKPTAGATGHAHCAATDPFGGPCQNVPRRPSNYCVIHSYLDR